jgi:hypothetical protein
MKNKRIIAAALIFMVLVFAAGYFSFKIIYSPQKLTKIFQKVMTGTLNRKVVIGGAELKLGTVILKDIRVEFEDKAQGGASDEHEEEDFIRCDKIKIKYRLLPLIKNKFVFREIKIQSPVLTMMSKPILDVKQVLQKKNDKRPIVKGVNFKINMLEISDGQVNLFTPDLPEIKIKDIKLNIKRAAEDILAVKLDFRFQDSKFEACEMESTIEINKNRAEISRMILEAYGGQFDIKGKIKNLLIDPYFDITYSAEKYPDGLLGDNVRIKGQPNFKGSIENTLHNLYFNWRLDFSGCDFSYGQFFKKSEGETLRFQGGLIRKLTSYDISWYVLECLGASVSGTGSVIDSKNIELNIIAEALDLKRMLKNMSGANKYIGSGIANINGKFSAVFTDEGGLDSEKFRGGAVISGFNVKGYEKLSSLYYKISKIKKKEFRMEKINLDFYVNKERLKIVGFDSRGGDLEARAKGNLEWNKSVNFVVYPRIYGKEIGLRIYGRPDKIKIGLK